MWYSINILQNNLLPRPWPHVCGYLTYRSRKCKGYRVSSQNVLSIGPLCQTLGIATVKMFSSDQHNDNDPSRTHNLDEGQWSYISYNEASELDHEDPSVSSAPISQCSTPPCRTVVNQRDPTEELQRENQCLRQVNGHYHYIWCKSRNSLVF